MGRPTGANLDQQPRHFGTVRRFAEGGGEPTALVAVVFAADPVLGSVAVGSQRLTFLSPIGITDAEYQVCAQGLPESVLTKLLAVSPLGVVDLRRDGLGAGAFPGAARCGRARV